MALPVGTSSRQASKTFLLEVTVGGQSIRNAAFAYHDKAYRVAQRVRLIWPPLQQQERLSVQRRKYPNKRHMGILQQLEREAENCPAAVATCLTKGNVSCQHIVVGDLAAALSKALYDPDVPTIVSVLKTQ